MAADNTVKVTNNFDIVKARDMQGALEKYLGDQNEEGFAHG